MSDAESGASRRDLLRGSALGVGALVGAMALTNANETAADAAGVTRSYDVTMTGINPNTKVKLTSVAFGGDLTNGSAIPEIVTLALPSSRFSPLLLKAFAEKASTIKATIRGYQPNVNGVQSNFVTITCTGSQIVHYHLGISSSGAPTDNLQLTYATIDLNWLLNNVHYTWVVPA
jgi:type VI protein secretion system component Hcp